MNVAAESESSKLGSENEGCGTNSALDIHGAGCASEKKGCSRGSAAGMHGAACAVNNTQDVKGSQLVIEGTGKDVNKDDRQQQNEDHGQSDQKDCPDNENESSTFKDIREVPERKDETKMEKEACQGVGTSSLPVTEDDVEFSNFTIFYEMDVDPYQLDEAVKMLNETNDLNAASSEILSAYGLARYVRPPGENLLTETNLKSCVGEPVLPCVPMDQDQNQKIHARNENNANHSFDEHGKKIIETSQRRVIPPMPNYIGKAVLRSIEGYEEQLNRRHNVECFEQQLLLGRYLTIPRSSMWRRRNGCYRTSNEALRGQGSLYMLRQTCLRDSKGVKAFVLKKLSRGAFEALQMFRGQCLSYEILTSCDVDRQNEIWEWISWTSEVACATFLEHEKTNRQATLKLWHNGSSVDHGSDNIESCTKMKFLAKLEAFDIDSVCERERLTTFWERNSSGSFFVPELWR